MNRLIWIDGQLVPRQQAVVSVFDHGLLYGDGVFEGIRQYNGRVLRLPDHLRRLYDSAKAIRLEMPLPMSEMGQAIEKTIAANDLSDCYIRVVVTRGVGPLGISPSGCLKPTIIIIADTISLYPAEMYRSGMAVVTAATPRISPAALSPRIKSLNYLNNIMAKWEAIDAGVPEAVMLNHLGFVCECTADNIFIVRGGALHTPPEESGILIGVTRNIVLEIAAENKIPAHQTNLTRYDLYTADECFLTGTGAEIVPVTSIDKRKIGPGGVGPITEKLIEAFHQYVRRG